MPEQVSVVDESAGFDNFADYNFVCVAVANRVIFQVCETNIERCPFIQSQSKRRGTPVLWVAEIGDIVDEIQAELSKIEKAAKKKERRKE